MSLPEQRFCHTRTVRRNPRNRDGVRPGFSLIESLVVITLVGILALMMAPKVGREISHAQVNRASTVIAGELEQAFTMAARQRKPVRISFDGALRAYTISDRVSGTPLQTRTFDAQSGFALSTLTATPATIDVFPTGVASSALTITIGAAEYSRQITMSRVGQVRVGAR